MQALKPALRVIRGIVPIIYCGYLVYYFLDVSGSVQEAANDGLGPTILGLGAVGLLFSVPFILNIVRFLAGLHAAGRGGGGGSAASKQDDTFDADAVIARYQAQQSTPAGPSTPAAPFAPKGGGPAKGPSFGRKTK